jgi:hypothetical protein
MYPKDNNWVFAVSVHDDFSGVDMNTCIYDKTDKGREEIATRKYRVAPKLRTLLVMIDGRHPLESLLKNFAGLGLTEESVNELLDQQYIKLVSGGPAASVAPPAAARPPASARARMLARPRVGAPQVQAEAQRHGAATHDAQAFAADLHEAASDDAGIGATGVHEAAAHEAKTAPAEAGAAHLSMNQADQFRALYEFYNQTVKSTLGLRGFVLQLKVEKAAGIDDFRALRLPYLEAVQKARGKVMAQSLRDRLDQLLGGKPEVDGFVLAEG